MRSILVLQKNFQWSNDYYLSPVSIINEDRDNMIGLDAPFFPEFYTKTFPNTHRG